MHVILLIAGLLLALVALAAEAGMKAGPTMAGPGHHRLKSAAGVAPPLDGVTAPAAAYSLRKLRSAYSGNSVKLRRATGGTQDIGFLGFVPGLGSPIDMAAANAFCAATTCWFDTWYDQSGNGRNAVQATTANQPAYVPDCNGTLPCARVTTATQELDTAGTVTVTSPVSLSAVGNRRSGTGACTPVFIFFNYIYTQPGQQNWVLKGLAEYSAPAADGAWHAAAGVIGPASAFRVDDTETTGAAPIQPGTGSINAPWNGTVGTTCDWTEAVVWNGYALTAGERSALVNNQRAFGEQAAGLLGFLR